MDWGSIISSVLPTIGGVVGSLLGVKKIEDGIIHFSHEGVQGSQKGFSSDFYSENGQIYLFNQSKAKEDLVTIAFPARGDIGADTVILPGRQSFNVTPIFQQNSQKDNQQFELTACTVSQQAQKLGGQTTQGIKISSSAKNLQVNGQKQQIGAYLDVQITPSQITVMPSNGIQLQSLPMLYVQGGGETGIRLVDIQGDGQKAVVPLPEPLVDKDMVSVQVVANVDSGSLTKLLELQANDSRFKTVSDDVADRIKNAPRLNWR